MFRNHIRKADFALVGWYMKQALNEIISSHFNGGMVLSAKKRVKLLTSAKDRLLFSDSFFLLGKKTDESAQRHDTLIAITFSHRVHSDLQ